MKPITFPHFHLADLPAGLWRRIHNVKLSTGNHSPMAVFSIFKSERNKENCEKRNDDNLRPDRIKWLLRGRFWENS